MNQPSTLANVADPIVIKELKVSGVAANAALEGHKVSVIHRLSVTSDERYFDKIASGLVGTIEHALAQQGSSADLRGARTILLITHPDDTAHLWVDTAAQVAFAMVKKSVTAGQPIFESDVGDITAIDFPAVEIGNCDGVVCLFRENWRFGLFFDFNPEKEFDRERMKRSLGTLHRTMRYRQVYEIIYNEKLFADLSAKGWFPFVEALTEFRQLAEVLEAGLPFDEFESHALEAFTPERVEHMFERWMLRPHFAGKQALLRAAVSAYLSDEPIAPIKIALTEIEGVLRDAYRAVHGKGAKLKTLLKFSIQSAEKKAGGSDTLLFSAAFAKYLEAYTFANFDPNSSGTSAASRHAVGHGAADAASYTKVRALQALLTLDQLSFYT